MDWKIWLNEWDMADFNSRVKFSNELAKSLIEDEKVFKLFENVEKRNQELYVYELLEVVESDRLGRVLKRLDMRYDIVLKRLRD